MDLAFTYLLSSDQNYSLKYMPSKTAAKGKKEVGEGKDKTPQQQIAIEHPRPQTRETQIGVPL